MVKHLHFKFMLLLCALMAGSGSVWAESSTMTATPQDVSSVLLTGTVPEGVSATFKSTYTNTNQITKGNSHTLTLKNMNGYKITELELSMKSNSSGGAGKLSYSTDGGTTFSYLVGDSDSGVAFNNSTWYGNWSTSYVNITKSSLNIECGTSDVVIKIEATVNSLYCQSYTITYEPTDPRTPIATDVTLSPTTIDFNQTNKTFDLTVTPATGKTSSDYTVSCESDDETILTALGTEYETYTNKGYVTVTVTVTPTAVNEADYKPFSKDFTVKVCDVSANDGSVSKPFNVTEAREFQSTPDVFYDADEYYYVQGWVSKKGSISSGHISYYISVDGTETNQIYIYRGIKASGTNFSSDDDLELADEVVVYGKLGTRSVSGTTYVAFSEESYITTLNRRTRADISFKNEQLNAYPNQPSFTGSELNNDNNVDVTYSTSNSAIADVDTSTGAITIGSTEGTATITATYTGTITPTVSPYKTTTATYKIKVAREANGLEFPASPNITTHANDAAVTEPVLTNPHSLQVTWTSSNDAVATVTSDGQVTTHETEGTATITATYTQTDQYKGGSVSYKVTVAREDLDFAFSPTSVTLTNSTDDMESFVAPTFSSSVSGIVFNSSYENVATVSNTGVISLGGSTGTAIITAAFVQNDYYHAHSATCTITVNPVGVTSEPSVPGNYQRITSTDDLTNGANYLIVNETAEVALGGQNSTYRGAVNVEITSNSISDVGEATVITLVKSGDNWKLQFDNGNYYTTSAAKSMSESTTGTEASISFSDNNAIIQFGSYGTLQYNTNSPRFLNYTSTQTVIQLYKFVAGDPVNDIDIYVSDAGIATYTSNFDLDYSSASGLEAYIATDDEGTVKLTKTDVIPAGTGVLLRATGGGKTYSVNTTTATDEQKAAVSGNLLKRGTGAAVASEADGKYNYILNVVDNKIGFYKANGMTVATNRAYLQTTSSAARIAIDFEEASGITSAEDRECCLSDAVYTLDGRKVTVLDKQDSLQGLKTGLYIVGGRKVVVK